MTTMTNPPNIHIHQATLADIPALVNLLDVLFGIEQDFSADHAKQTTGLRMLIESPERGSIQVAHTTNGELVGMVSAQLVISTAEGAPSAWVEDMVVDQRFRALGIGRQLLNSVLDWAKEKGATRAQLLVDLDNLPAVGYYDHLGWTSSRMGMRRIMLK